VNNFKASHPQEEVVAVSGVKVVKSKPTTEIDTGTHWITSKRVVAILTNKRLKFGDVDIPLSSITHAELYKFTGLISKGQLLNITTNDDVGYQLGMQVNEDWLDIKELNLEYTTKKLKISTFSWIMRGVLAAFLMYIVYEKLIK